MVNFRGDSVKSRRNGPGEERFRFSYNNIYVYPRGRSHCRSKNRPCLSCNPLFRFMLESFLQKSQHRGLFGRQLVQRAGNLALHALTQCFQKRAVEIRINHGRMNVALSADGLGIAQPFRYRFDGRDNVALGLRLRVKAGELLQGAGGQHRARPGAEVLGREFLPGDLLDVGIDIRRIDVVGGAVTVEILKQFLARQILAALHDARQPAVVHADAVANPALAAKGKLQARPFDCDVSVAQRGQAEGTVGAGVLLVADADESGFEQADHGGQHLRPWQPWLRQILFDAGADGRQRLGEGDHSVVFRLIADSPPARVVAILLAAPGIVSGGLQMAIGERTNPYRCPGRRDGERADALQRLGIADGLAVWAKIAKLLSLADAADSGVIVVHVAQSRLAGRFEGIDYQANLLTASCFLEGPTPAGGAAGVRS